MTPPPQKITAIVIAKEKINFNGKWNVTELWIKINKNKNKKEARERGTGDKAIFGKVSKKKKIKIWYLYFRLLCTFLFIEGNVEIDKQAGRQTAC